MTRKPSSPRLPVSEQHAELLGNTLFRIRSELSDAIEEELARLQSDLRIAQVQVLLRLACQDHLTAGELARAVGHDPGALTRLVDQLVQKGLVVRQPHETDRRALRIALTKAGRDSFQMLYRIRMQVMERMLRDLEGPEREQLMDYLQRMLDGLQSRHQQA